MRKNLLKCVLGAAAAIALVVACAVAFVPNWIGVGREVEEPPNFI